MKMIGNLHLAEPVMLKNFSLKLACSAGFTMNKREIIANQIFELISTVPYCNEISYEEFYIRGDALNEHIVICLELKKIHLAIM